MNGGGSQCLADVGRGDLNGLPRPIAFDITSPRTYGYTWNRYWSGSRTENATAPRLVRATVEFTVRTAAVTFFEVLITGSS